MNGYTETVMEIFLVRHGQSEANAGLTDFLDSPLTPLGQEQARLTGNALLRLGLTNAYVSPLRRTLETIQPFCKLSGLRAEVNADVCEYFNAAHPVYHSFPGLSPAQISDEFPLTFFGQTFPCGEAWWPQVLENDAIIYARCVRVRDTLLSHFTASSEKILIVSHAETVGRLTEAFLRIPPNPIDPPWSDNCAITHLRMTNTVEAPAELFSQNDTAHLAGLVTHATG